MAEESNKREAVIRAAASKVDVIDAAGRILGYPQRNACDAPIPMVYALASAVERFWEICLEAELLVRALALPEGTAEEAGLKTHAIETQAATVKRLMNALRAGDEEELNHE